MNYHYQPASEIAQSDEILRKLNQIKSSIEGRQEYSPKNLNDYIPQEKLHTSSQHIDKNESGLSNPQSYRLSLEKKLERLFKQERKNFHENQAQSRIEVQGLNYSQLNGLSNKKDVFTIEGMQNKIRELERKYLETNPISEEKPRKAKKAEQRQWANETKKQNIKGYDQQSSAKKKTRSMVEKMSIKKQKQKEKEKEKERGRKQEGLQQKSDKKLMTQISVLKKELRTIKQSHLELNQKIVHKQQQRKQKKERSRYLLACILHKLIQIQQEVKKRQKTSNKLQKEEARTNPPKGSMEQRQILKRENSLLIRQVEELRKAVKKQASEKEKVLQRTQWIENQLRKRSQN